jgi:RNA polymerase sigma factor (sigma-70 family)
MPKTSKTPPVTDLQSVKIRQDLVLDNLRHIKAAAARIMRQYPWCKSEVTLTDLEQEGALGAMQAAAHFKPDKGVTFWSFAWRRVEGRMVDMFQDRNYDHVLSSNARGFLPNVDIQRALHRADPNSLAPYEAVESDSSHRAVLRVMRTLTDRNQQILQQYCFDDKPYTEIAKGLARRGWCRLGKSQVHFWHHQSLQDIRLGLEAGGMNAAAFFTNHNQSGAPIQDTKGATQTVCQ